MKIKSLILSLVAVCVLAVGARGSSITVQAQSIQGVFAPQLASGNPVVTMRVFASKPFLSNDSPPISIPSGSPQGTGRYYQSVTCAYTLATGTIAIPSFSLICTTDALAPPNGIQATYTFAIFVNGGFLDPNPISYMTQIQVPPQLASHTACVPHGACGDFVDLQNNSFGVPLPTPPQTTYNTQQINAFLAAITAGAGSPTLAKYIVNDPTNAPTNGQQLSTLGGPGLLKVSAPGLLSVALANTDFQSPLVFPLGASLGGSGVNNGTFTSTLGGNLVTANPFTTSGAFPLTLTVAGATNVTLPQSGVLLTATGNGAGIAFPGSLSIAGGKTATFSNTLTFTGTDGSSAAFGAGGTVAYTANNLSVFAPTTSAQFFSVISDATGSGSVVGATAPTITGGTHRAITSLGIRSTGAAFDLTLASSEALSAGRTLTITLNDAPRTLTVAGNATVSGTNTGDQTITLTGNVTGSGTGSFATTIAANAVTNAMLQNSSFTLGSTSVSLGGTAGTIAGLTLTQPTIGDFTNSTHTHQNAAGGGTLANAALQNSSITVQGTPVSLGGSTLATTATPQFAALGLGTAAPTAGLLNLGKTINTDSDGTIASLDTQSNLIKNDANARNFVNARVFMTINPGVNNLNTTLTMLKVDDSVPGAMTGVTAITLLDLRHNGVQEAFVDSGGNGTFAGNLTVTGGSVNKVAITQPASAATLTLANNKTFTVNNTMTLAGVDSQTYTFPAATDTLVGRGSTDTLTNKTLTSSTNTLGAVTTSLGGDADYDLYYRLGGVLTRLGKGGNGTFVGISGGVIGYFTPTGSGTVNSGTAGNLAYYAASAAAVSTVPGTSFNSTNQSMGWTGAAVSGGSSLWTWTPGAHTNVGAEVNDLLVSAHTMTVSGGFTNERFTWFRTPTITASAGGLTVSNPATVAIENAPQASNSGGSTPTLGSLVNNPPLAFWVMDGGVRFGPATYNAQLTWNPYSTDTVGNPNSGGASLLLEPVLADTTNVHTQGLFIRPTFGTNNTAGNPAKAALGIKMGNPGTPIAAGVKGIFSAVEINNFDTSQGIADVSEPSHGFGVTMGAHGTAGIRGIAMVQIVDTATSHAVGYISNITQNSAVDTADFTEAGSWNFQGWSSGSVALTGVLRAAPVSGGSYVHGIDLSPATFSSDQFKGAGFVVDGSGTITSGKLYGGTGAGSTLTLNGSSNAAPVNAYVLVNPLQAGVSPGLVAIGASPTSLAGGSPFVAGDIFHVQAQDSQTSTMYFDAYGANGSVTFRAAAGSSAIPAASAAGLNVGQIAARVYTGAAYASGNNAAINFVNAEPVVSTPTATGMHIVLKTTPVGTTTITEVGRWMANGGMQLNLATAVPVAGDFLNSSPNSAIIYVHGNKLVIASNSGGTTKFVSIPLDGSTGTWTNGTGALP